MLEGLKKFVIRNGYTLLRKKRVKCPECNEPLELPVKLPKGGLEGFIECAQCGWRNSLSSLLAAGSRVEEEDYLREKPSHSKIEKVADEEDQTWLIPAKRKLNFLIFFGTVWLLFTGLFTTLVFFGEPVEGNGEQLEDVWVGLFLVPFWLIGIGVMYFGLRMSLSAFSIVVNNHELRVSRHFLGRQRDKKIALEEIEEVKLNVAYTQNDTPVYEVCLLGKAKNKIGFGSSLTKEEKAWMVHELHEACGLKKSFSFDADGELQGIGKIDESALEEISSKHLRIERMMGRGFRLTTKPAYLCIVFIAGGIFMSVGLIFVIRAFMDLLSIEELPTGWALFSMLFEFLPLLLGTAAMIVGTITVGIGFYFLGCEKVFEFGDRQVIILKKKKGSVTNRTRLNRSDIKRITAKGSGSVNDEPRYEVFLEGGKKYPIARFVTKAHADVIRAWVSYWLQQEDEA